MADEATDTVEATTETASGGSSSGSGSTGKSDVPPEKLPYLEPGAVDPAPGTRDEHGREVSRWVTYLQQMINYTYQQAVVMEDGVYDNITANAVKHFREQQHLPPGEYVDKELWLKLGAEDLYEKWEQQQANKKGRGGTKQGQQGSGQQHGQQHGADDDDDGSFEDVDFGVSMIQAPSNSSCWAATLAIMLNYREGGGFDVDTVCERANASQEEWIGGQRAEAVGQELGLRQQTCYTGTAAGWAEILHNFGPAWCLVPGQDYQSFVVAGVRTVDGKPEILVLDPTMGSESWLAFTEFGQSYGFAEQSQSSILV